MIKLILLYITLLTGIVFLIIPETTEAKDYFLFSDMKLYFGTYVYFIFEKLILIVLAYVIAADETVYRKEVQVFFYLMLADLFDFVLTYNSIWFHIGIPVSMNILKAIIFGIVITKAWIGNQYYG